MIRFVLIARAEDGLPLVSTIESNSEEDSISGHKRLSKSLLRLLQSRAAALATKASINAGDFVFHYTVESGITFQCLCDKNYPRLLAFSFLAELSKGFFDEIRNQSLKAFVRPYSLIRFEPFIQSTRRRYENTRQLRPNEDLVELSSRVQSLPTYIGEEVFGATEYSKALGGGSSGIIQPLANLKSSIKAALIPEQELPPSRGEKKSSSTLLKSALYLVSVVVALVDAAFLTAFYILPRSDEVSSVSWLTWVGGAMTPMKEWFITSLGFLSPFLLLQAHMFKTTGQLPKRLSDISTVHVIITTLFVIYAMRGVAIERGVSELAAVMADAGAVPNAAIANIPKDSGAAIGPPLPPNMLQEAKPNARDNGASEAAKSFTMVPVLPFWLIGVKGTYLVLMWYMVGVGAVRRWMGYKGPKTRSD